jgi:hypothetical protein
METNVVDELINYYKSMYKKKFAIDCEEVVDKKLVARTFINLNEAVDDVETSLDILHKAIVWYLYQHDNTTPDGGNFPYQFRILLEQAWLLRSCIEASRSANIELLMKAQDMNLTQKQLASAIRRGDIAGIDNGENIPKLLEEVLIEIEKLIGSKPLQIRREFKKHPKIKELYTSELPSAEYIRKAQRFLVKVKENEQDIQ